MLNISISHKVEHNYLKKYPGNSYGIKEYASIIRQQGNPEEALKILSQSTKNASYIMREKAYNYIQLGEYELALNELNQIPKQNAEVEDAKAFCHARMGQCDEIERNDYYNRQFLSYSKKRAIDYICNNPKQNISPHINITEVYNNIEMIIEKSTPVITIDFLKKYYFYIPSIGKVDGELTNYLGVYTSPDLLEILDMRPTKKERNITINNYESLLSQKEEGMSKTKTIKRESQLDKFNRRYGNNQKI